MGLYGSDQDEPIRTLEEEDAGIEELLGPGEGIVQVEGADLQGAAADQLQTLGGTDKALPSVIANRTPTIPSFSLRCISAAA
jgi:hypothetical protein